MVANLTIIAHIDAHRQTVPSQSQSRIKVDICIPKVSKDTRSIIYDFEGRIVSIRTKWTTSNWDYGIGDD